MKIGFDEKQNLEKLLQGKENNYNFLRLAAAILVIFSHAYPITGNDNEPLLRFSNDQITLGNLAVYSFFIISGMLITQSYVTSNNFISFIKSRALRIFPGLIGVILFSVFILGPLFTTSSLSGYFSSPETRDYIKSILLFPMYWNLPGVFEGNIYPNSINGSLWTIPFEVLCYLTIAILGLIGALKRKYLMLLIGITCFYYYVYNKTIMPMDSFVLGLQVSTLVELLSCFLGGSLLFLFRKYIILKKEVVMVSIIILFISLYYGGFKYIYVIAGPYLIAYLAFIPKLKFKMKRNFGDISYGVYLYAFPIQQVVSSFSKGINRPWENFLVSTPLTLIMAFVSWHVIEKNFMQLKKIKMLPFLWGLIPFQNLRGNSERIFFKFSTYWKEKKQRVYIYLNLSWPKFFFIFLLFALSLAYYNKIPSVISFPYFRSESIFHEGWLPQNVHENYRWIAKKASVDIEIPSGNVVINIKGYIPDNFKEINNVNIYVDDQLQRNYEVKPSEGFSLEAPYYSLAKSKHLLSIEFNSIHKPLPTEADIREMSALISKISVKER